MDFLAEVGQSYNSGQRLNLPKLLEYQHWHHILVGNDGENITPESEGEKALRAGDVSDDKDDTKKLLWMIAHDCSTVTISLESNEVKDGDVGLGEKLSHAVPTVFKKTVCTLRDANDMTSSMDSLRTADILVPHSFDRMDERPV